MAAPLSFTEPPRVSTLWVSPSDAWTDGAFSGRPAETAMALRGARLRPAGLVLGLDRELVLLAVLGLEGLGPALGIADQDLGVQHAVAERRDPEAAHGVAVVLGRAPGPAHVQEPVAGADRGRGVGHGRLQRRAGRDAVTGRQAAHRPPTEGVLGREGEADVGPVLQPLPTCTR